MELRKLTAHASTVSARVRRSSLLADDPFAPQQRPFKWSRSRQAFGGAPVNRIGAIK